MGGIKEKKSASSIFSKDVEHDFPKEIKTEIKFAFVRNVGEALEEVFGKEVVEGWKRWVVEGNEDRLGEEEVVMMSMVMMMSGIGARVVMIRMCLREGVLYGLEAGCE